jgi:hypothetical protein
MGAGEYEPAQAALEQAVRCLRNGWNRERRLQVPNARSSRSPRSGGRCAAGRKRLARVRPAAREIASHFAGRRPNTSVEPDPSRPEAAGH